MRKFGAMEGDIRLRLGARIKRNNAGFALKSRARRLGVFGMWGGGGGLFIYTADEYPLAHIDSGTFSLISNDIFREGVVCWQKNLMFTYF